MLFSKEACCTIHLGSGGGGILAAAFPHVVVAASPLGGETAGGSPVRRGTVIIGFGFPLSFHFPFRFPFRVSSRPPCHHSMFRPGALQLTSQGFLCPWDLSIVDNSGPFHERQAGKTT